MRVGVNQYFLLHCVHFQRDSGTEKVEHAFAYVLWKKFHSNSDFYGVTSTVMCLGKKLHSNSDFCGLTSTISSSLFETPAAYCFLPVQRIASLAAHAIITVDFDSIEEPVFVTSPLSNVHFL